ncbi:lysosomal Pro-X carboxypeptidase-like protein [Corchorus olitorius]|uniref:Lysosomal Pro-X carboxypeptidase-like protein n=1 Tax=Corchorus olitorius TaxID=93759 RepID=A0A1R3KNX2_9ROSI|nr:lysosomal Pro-X carboxypeptidase-like protein [Corchorus olitorius]
MVGIVGVNWQRNGGDIEWFAQNTGFMFDVAPSFKALLDIAAFTI